MNKRYLILIAIVVFLGLSIAGLYAISTSANDPKTETALEEGYFYSYEIRENDSLWSIASVYAKNFGLTTAEYVDLLRDMNQLTCDRLITGDHIVIIYAAE